MGPFDFLFNTLERDDLETQVRQLAPQRLESNIERIGLWPVQGDLENPTISVDLEKVTQSDLPSPTRSLCMVARRFRVQADQSIGRNHPLTFGQEHQWVDIELDDG